jgi:hypothetical protein
VTAADATRSATRTGRSSPPPRCSSPLVLAVFFEGDIVRVVIEGEVLSAHGRRLDISGGHSVILDNVVSVEVLRPPVKVGDVIEQWQGLPGGSILADSDGRACQVFEFDDRSPTLQALGGASYGPFTVLYLPDGAA